MRVTQKIKSAINILKEAESESEKCEHNYINFNHSKYYVFKNNLYKSQKYNKPAGTIKNGRIVLKGHKSIETLKSVQKGIRRKSKRLKVNTMSKDYEYPLPESPMPEKSEMFEPSEETKSPEPSELFEPAESFEPSESTEQSEKSESFEPSESSAPLDLSESSESSAPLDLSESSESSKNNSGKNTSNNSGKNTSNNSGKNTSNNSGKNTSNNSGKNTSNNSGKNTSGNKGIFTL